MKHEEKNRILCAIFISLNVQNNPRLIMHSLVRSKYFGQLYVVHAHFPARQFDDKDQNIPWQRRTLPCVWVLMKKRRRRD